MAEAEDAAMIARELKSDDAEVRAKFKDRYGRQTDGFAKAMGEAVVNWRSLDVLVGKDEARGYVSGLTYSAIMLHVMSMKLLLAGQIIAAGNLYRQVVESMALALLCSGGKKLFVLERFMADQYSTNDSVRHLLKFAEKLGVNEAASVLKEVQEFNHAYSHPSKFTLGHSIPFDRSEGVFVGAAFDEGKVEFYDKEIASRCSCADIFSNFIDGVKMNMSQWGAATPKPAIPV